MRGKGGLRRQTRTTYTCHRRTCYRSWAPDLTLNRAGASAGWYVRILRSSRNALLMPVSDDDPALPTQPHSPGTYRERPRSSSISTIMEMAEQRTPSGFVLDLRTTRQLVGGAQPRAEQTALAVAIEKVCQGEPERGAVPQFFSSTFVRPPAVDATLTHRAVALPLCCPLLPHCLCSSMFCKLHI
jgi:hypothetical protein